jgi:general secretion pathway protein L
MRTLIIELASPGPALEPGRSWTHALIDGDPATAALVLRQAPLDLLPRPDRQTETVALVPASALSWQAVEWPLTLRRQRPSSRAVLDGLLEERLLDELGELHLALPPALQPGQRIWVAVCKRSWLSDQLQALEAAGLSVDRIVPALCPARQGRRLLALGEAPDGWLWCTDAEAGVWGMPAAALSSPEALAALWPSPGAPETDPERLAEPGMAAWLEQRLGQAPQLVTPAERWREALASGWDLAQFEFSARRSGRRLQALARALQPLWHAPRWRAARWGAALLLISQLAGLQAWSWVTRQGWQDSRQAMEHMLRAQFPDTRVVVDAPLQMAREVARLRQATGELSPTDFESMMNALGKVWPAAQTPASVRYEAGQLSLVGLRLDAQEHERLTRALAERGYRWQTQAQGKAATLSVLPAGTGSRP